MNNIIGVFEKEITDCDNGINYKILDLTEEFEAEGLTWGDRVRVIIEKIPKTEEENSHRFNYKCGVLYD